MTQSQNATYSGDAAPNQRAMNARASSVPCAESEGSTPSTMYLNGHGLSEFTMIAAKVRIAPPSVGAWDMAEISKCSDVDEHELPLLLQAGMIFNGIARVPTKP